MERGEREHKHKDFLKLLYVFILFFIGVCVCVGAEKDTGSPGAGVTGDCELPNMGAKS